MSAVAFHGYGQQADWHSTFLKEALMVHPVEDFIDSSMNYSDQWITVQSISVADVDGEFSSMEDSDWLDEMATNTKGILIGETHNYKFINQIKNRLIFHFAKEHEFRMVMVEDAYPMTPFIRHYLAIADDHEAQKFFSSALSDFISTVEDSLFYNHVRRWNKLYPDRKIDVALYDVGNDYFLTLEKIVRPFAETRYPDLPKISEQPLEQELLSWIKLLDTRLCYRDRSSMTLPSGITISAAFVKSALSDIQSAIESYLFDKHVYRQLAIVRNLTDSNFLGTMIEDSKFILYGGAYHMNKEVIYPKHLSFMREAGYLHQQWPVTTGNIRSILIEPGAMEIDESIINAGLSVDVVPQSAVYNDISVRANVAWNERILDFGSHCFVHGYPQILERHLMVYGIRKRLSAFLFENIDWDYLRMHAQSGYETSSLSKARYELSAFDYVIFVPVSPATRPRVVNSQ